MIFFIKILFCVVSYCPNNPITLFKDDEEPSSIDWQLLSVELTNLLGNGGNNVISYEQVAEWMTQKHVFELLANHPTLLSSTVLNNFYNNFANTPIGTMYNADVAIASLTDFEESEAEMIDKYNVAMTTNNAIVPRNDYEINERVINITAMKIARFGSEVLNVTEKLEIEILANTCPFVGGDAVYKARTLQTLFNPLAQYNDRITCLQTTANKGGATTNLDNLDSLYEAQTNEQANAIIEKQLYDIDNLVSVYPNPTTDYVVVNYESKTDGEFRLLNTLGEVIMKEKVMKGNQQTIKLMNVDNGIYHYELKFTNKKESVGKLTIIN